MNDCVLSINAGSSSVKFAAYSSVAATPLLAGMFTSTDGITVTGMVTYADGETTELIPKAWTPEAVCAALELLVSEQLSHIRIVAVAHRLVYGPVGSAHQIITEELIHALEPFMLLAPLHMQFAVGIVQTLQTSNSDIARVPHVACFDTVFHATLPAAATTLPLSRELRKHGMRRFGFHGLVCAGIVRALAVTDTTRTIIAHLGHGASITAVCGTKSIATTMSYTPTSGIPMSSRSGDLDPMLVLTLLTEYGYSPAHLRTLLTRESGLLGVSERSSDMRELLAQEANDPRAALAITIFVRNVVERIGGYAALLGGVDQLVFSGGIGEHAPVIRARICEQLALFGIVLDAEANAANAPVISRSGVAPMVRVVEANEEAEMARTAFALLNKS